MWYRRLSPPCMEMSSVLTNRFSLESRGLPGLPSITHEPEKAGLSQTDRLTALRSIPHQVSVPGDLSSLGLFILGTSALRTQRERHLDPPGQAPLDAVNGIFVHKHVAEMPLAKLYGPSQYIKIYITRWKVFI